MADFSSLKKKITPSSEREDPLYTQPVAKEGSLDPSANPNEFLQQLLGYGKLPKDQDAIVPDELGNALLAAPAGMLANQGMKVLGKAMPEIETQAGRLLADETGSVGTGKKFPGINAKIASSEPLPVIEGEPTLEETLANMNNKPTMDQLRKQMVSDTSSEFKKNREAAYALKKKTDRTKEFKK